MLPGHALWKRDFRGASGLFGVELRPSPKAAVDAFLNGLELFGMGASFGGFESLAIPMDPRRIAPRRAGRTTVPSFACTSASRIRTISSPISLAGSIECADAS